MKFRKTPTSRDGNTCGDLKPAATPEPTVTATSASNARTPLKEKPCP